MVTGPSHAQAPRRGRQPTAAAGRGAGGAPGQPARAVWPAWVAQGKAAPGGAGSPDLRPNQLAASRPGDALEREADQTAEHVAAALERTGSPRGCGSCSHAHSEAITPSGRAVQRKAVGGSAPSDRAADTLSGRFGDGQPLAGAIRALVEPHLGADLSGVRVHTGGAASESAGAIHARAYTLGRDIVFDLGQFSPHTRSGRRLLAHELAHVVQQAGGDGPDRAPMIAADGGLSDQDAALIASWLDDSPQAGKQVRWAGFPAAGSLFGPGRLPAAQVFGGGTLPSGTLLAGTCPGPCHQVNDAMRRQYEQRVVEQRIAERKARWRGLVTSQSQEDIEAQSASLTEEMDTTSLALAQARLNLFNRVLQQQASTGPAMAGGVQGPLTPQMRDAWQQAEALAAAVAAVMRIDDRDIPVELAASLRIALRAFYATLPRALRVLDEQDQRHSDLLKARPCPGSCHTAVAEPPVPRTKFFPSSGLRGSPGFGGSSQLGGLGGTSTWAPASRPGPNADPSLLGEPVPGPRERRLAIAVAALSTAGSGKSLTAAIEDFRWASDQMEAVIRLRVPIEASTKDELERLEYAGGLLQRQREFAAKYPTAIKIPAVFYPHEAVEVQTRDFGETKESARAIPWQFYLVRSELDPRGVQAGFLWELHDITAPVQGRPKIQVRQQLTMMEALEIERLRLKPGQNIHDIDVLRELFEQLDSPDFFTEGLLYWYSPISNRYEHVTMHDRTPVGEWLIRIGMGIAILGSLVFAPFSTPMLISAAVGTGLTIAGRVIRLDEKRRHGVLQESDVRRFYWDLAMDVVSATTLGFGRAVAVAGEAETLVRASSVARAYFLLKRVQLSADVINVGVIAHDFITQFQAIRDSAMTDEQKREAYISLAQMAFVTGFLNVVTIRSAVKHLHALPTLRLRQDSTGRLVGDGEPFAEEAGHSVARPGRRAVIVHQQEIRTPSGGTHTFALWSDGRITRCSVNPCGLLTDSVVGRVQDLQERALSDSAHLGGLDDLLVRARKLREDAAQVASMAGAGVQSAAPKLMARAKELEHEVEAMERRIADENAAAQRTGREEALRKYGPAALDHGPHYRWELRKEGLQLRRTTRAVPWMEFSNGKFVVTKPLFVPASAEELSRIRRTSSTRDFPVRATVRTRAALDKLRPPPRGQAQAPNDWVVVEINDQNLIEFIDEPIHPGVIYEYPDGSRAWRTPQNTIMTEGRVRAPIGRRGFEQGLPSATAEGGGVDLSATGVGHQRSHPAGQITGFEITGHIPYAPTYINQQLQAQGIEMFIKELNAAHPDLDLSVITEHAKIPRTLRQDWIEYTVTAGGAGPRRTLLKARITTNYANPSRPADVDIEVRTSNPDDINRLLDVDMPAARADLIERIRAAARRRRP